MTETAPAPASTTADDATGGIDPAIASELPPEAVEALKKSKGSKAKRAAPAAQEPLVEASTEPAATATTTAEPEPVKPAAAPEELVIDLSAEEAPAPAADDEHTISEDELNKLPEDFRKKYRGKDAENKKLRARSQEAEKEAARLREELSNARASSDAGLAGNDFAAFGPEATAEVAGWVNAAQEIRDRVTKINFAQARGRDITDEMLQVTLPNGKTVELDEALIERSAGWDRQASAWLKHHQSAAADKQAATALTARLKTYDGYETALEALRTANPGRETLLSKAALYDMIVAKKGQIKIPSAVTAAAANKAAGAPSRAPATTTLPAPTGGAALSAPAGGNSASAERARLMKLAAQGDQEALEKALLLPKS